MSALRPEIAPGCVHESIGWATLRRRVPGPPHPDAARRVRGAVQTPAIREPRSDR